MDGQAVAWIAIALAACHSPHSCGDMGRPPQSVPIVARVQTSESLTLPEASQEGATAWLSGVDVVLSLGCCGPEPGGLFFCGPRGQAPPPPDGTPGHFLGGRP